MKKFPDGANYRIEVSGIETPGILEAVIDEAKKQKIPIHRAISTVNGSVYWTSEQLKELARTAAQDKIEVIICPWKLAGLVFENPNRILTDLRLTDEETNKYLIEIDRCIKLGFRGFLVWDKDLLELLNHKMRKPSDIIFKLSTFANSLNRLNFASAAWKGANTINTVNGLSLEKLAKIRAIVPERVKLDIHVTFWQMVFEKNLKGRLELTAKPYDRIKDAPELARICSPCYFKFEAGNPGIGVYDLSGPNWTEKDLQEHKRKDVRTATKVVRAIEKKYPDIILSDWGPKDLRVPIASV